MALFQPTFVIPSTRTEGTVDVSDNMEIKWQVNGQSAMIAFKIDFFRNDWASTPVTTTGKQQVDGGGFRGIDRFGKVKFYTYDRQESCDRQESWNSFHPLFINGMQYKMQITQYYIDNPNEYYVRTSAVIDQETACYFGMPNQANPSQVDYYLSFTLPEGKYPMGTKISYNISSENGFVIKNNAPEFLIMTKSTTKPTTGTDLGISTNEESVVQRSMDVFRTFTKPTMALYKTPNEDFIWQDGSGEELLNPRNLSITTTMDLGTGTNNYFSFIQNGTQTKYASFTATNAISANTIIFYNTETKQCYYELNGEQVNLTITESTTQPIGANNIGKAYIDLATSIGYFHTNYMQEQGKPIRWVEWQVATANNGVVGDIIADTGKINTQTLDYSYNGFFNGQQYAIRCYGYSESEQYCDTGWIIFNVNIKAQGEYTGKFTVQCLPKENATLLQWEGVEVIPPRVSPEGYKPLIANGSVTLAPKNPETSEEYSVTWDKQIIVDNKESKTIPMNFEEPWTAVWKGNVGVKEVLLSQTLLDFGDADVSFSPNGEYMAIMHGKRIDIYRFNNGDIELFSSLSRNNRVTFVEFAPNNNMFIANGGTSNKIGIFEINNSGIVEQGSFSSFSSLNLGNQIAFSPNGKFLVINRGLWDVNGFEITFNKSLRRPEDANLGGGNVSFSSDGNLLAIGQVYPEVSSSSTGNEILIFAATENDYVYKETIISETKVSAVAFSPNGRILVVGSIETFPDNSYFNVYSINNENITFAYKMDNLNFLQNIYRFSFSYDGSYLFCMIYTPGFFNANLFLINQTNSMYLFSIQHRGTNYCKGLKFNPNSSPYVFLKYKNGNSLDMNIYDFQTQGIGKLFSIELNNNNQVSLVSKNGYIYISNNDMQVSDNMRALEYDKITVILQDNKALIYFYNNGIYQEKKSVAINIPQEPITSITINGGDNGIKIDSVSVYKGMGEDIIQLYDNNSNFEPVWNSNDYQLYMTANFNGNLEGGTGTSTGSGFRVYRREYNSNVLFPIATVPSTTLQVKDFGLRSGKLYEYYLYVYDSNGSFMTNVEGNQRVTTKYNSYSLMVCDYDSDRDEYHVRKQYLFINNATEGAMSNNNTPTINKNFTNYPTIMNSTSNYVSGTLSSLIGVIYTVPALIEQIGTYKFVKKPSTLDYFDSVDLQKELFQLSTLPYQLFLRDLKGNMRMIKIISPISMTVNSKQTQLSTSISLQWAEIDNADDITVVQTPDDYGWDYDNELLDVKLDVDTNSGMLSATYPRNYRGTTFSLVGANKEILQANTPIGITPANITLSNVATKTTDGNLNASFKVSKE